MAISVFCKTCAKTLRVVDEMAGKRLKCSGCGQVLAIPSGAGSTKAPAQGLAKDTIEPVAARPRTDSASRPLKEKPQCAPDGEDAPALRKPPKKKRRQIAPSFLSRNKWWFVASGATCLIALVIGLVVFGRDPRLTKGPQVAQGKSEDQPAPAQPAKTAKDPSPEITKSPPAQPNPPGPDQPPKTVKGPNPEATKSSPTQSKPPDDSPPLQPMPEVPPPKAVVKGPLQLGPNGEQLGLVGKPGHELGGLRKLRELVHGSGVTWAAFSADGAQIATLTLGGAGTYDVGTGKAKDVFRIDVTVRDIGGAATPADVQEARQRLQRINTVLPWGQSSWLILRPNAVGFEVWNPAKKNLGPVYSLNKGVVNSFTSWAIRERTTTMSTAWPFRPMARGR